MTASSKGENGASEGSSSSNATVYNNNKQALWITYINIVLYALCYQLQRPVEPFLVQELSKEAGAASVAKQYGQLQSFFSAIQTVGSPLVGILLDRIGLRHASCLVFAASAASYAILAFAQHDMPTLFYSKIPTALQHAFLVAQAVAATSCRNNEAARAQALGRMTTAYTIGATLGPALGGVLAEQGDLYVGARLAVVGSLVSVLLSLLFLPNQKKKATDDNDDDEKEYSAPKRSFMDEMKHSLSIGRRSNLWPLLTGKIISGVASSMYQTALPMVLTQAPLNFDPAALGLTMSSSMLASAAFGAFGMAQVTRALGGAMEMAKAGLLLRPALGSLVAYIVTTTATNAATSSSSTSLSIISIIIPRQIQIIAVSVLHGLCTHALATGLTTQTTGAVAGHEQGALLGLEHGLFSAARIGGPSLGTSILSAYNNNNNGFWAVALTCGGIDLSLLGVLVIFTASSSSSLSSSQLDLKNNNKSKAP